MISPDKARHARSVRPANGRRIDHHLPLCPRDLRWAPGQFYPYWTLASVKGACVWEFGQMPNGNDFGKDAQYGKFTTALGLPELAGPIMRNPSC